jgi:hypothetical protein
MKRATVFLACLGVMVFLGAATAGAQDFQHPASGTSNFVVTGTHSYYDSGGPDCDGTGGEYTDSETGVAVFCPATTGWIVTVEFLEVDTETSISVTTECYDRVYVFDGNSTAAPLLFSGCGEEGFPECTGFPGDGGDCGGTELSYCDHHGSNDATPNFNTFTSTDTSGCLTVEFLSDTSVQEGGWLATVSTQVPVELMQISVE